MGVDDDKSQTRKEESINIDRHILRRLNTGSMRRWRDIWSKLLSRYQRCLLEVGRRKVVTYEKWQACATQSHVRRPLFLQLSL